MLQIFHVSHRKKDSAGTSDLCQAGGGSLTACTAVAKLYGFQHIKSLKHRVHGTVDDPDLSLRIVLQHQRPGIHGRLQRTAEFGGNADTEHRYSLSGTGKKYFHIILCRRHGRLGIYPLSIHHLLVKIPDPYLHIFLQIFLIVKRHIKRYHRDILFLHQPGGKITGAVTDNMKCFLHNPISLT